MKDARPGGYDGRKKIAMKKLRRFLEVLLAINFFLGLRSGMKVENLALVILNGLLIIVLAVKEIRDGRIDEESRKIN